MIFVTTIVDGRGANISLRHHHVMFDLEALKLRLLLIKTVLINQSGLECVFECVKHLHHLQYY